MSHEPETIGPYRLLRRLGAGASGCVFEAEDPAAGRRVALKLLIAGAIQPDTLERFRREREALARVDHPHVLRVHAAGSWQGRPYLVTELLPGRTLSAVLGAGPVGLEAATRYALEVAEGLGALHAAGLIHRDIKPANVLLDEAGACKVADLGLAFCEGDRALTATGTLLGTPTYMSPEALAGKVVRDPSADVYSLGVLFYELLTGRPPHEGHNVFALAHARLEEPAPDPRVHAPGLPRGVAAVCRQALDVDPQARPRDGRAFAAALREAAREAEGPGAPSARRAGVVAAALGLAGALALAAAGARGGPVAPPATPAAEPLAAAPVTTNEPRPAAAALDEDGAWAARVEEARALGARLRAAAPQDPAWARLAALEATPLASWPAGDEAPLLRATSGGVLHLAGARLVWRSAGAAPASLDLPTALRDLVAAPAGGWLGVPAREGGPLLVLGAAGATPFAPAVTDARLAARAGERLVVVRGAASVLVLDAAGALLSERRVGQPGERVLALATSADGGAALLLGSEQDRAGIAVGLVWSALDGPPRGRRFVPTARDLALSPDGERLALAGTDGSVRLMDGPEATPRTLVAAAAGPARVHRLAWAPDGRRLYVAPGPGSVGAPPPGGVTVWDVARGEPLRTLGRPRAIVALDVSPDGEAVVVADDERVEVWTTSGDAARLRGP